MADWKHKQRNWSAWFQDDYQGDRIRVDGGRFKDDYLAFDDWLNMQCTNGWEVIKISRGFNTADFSTWCIFRKKN